MRPLEIRVLPLTRLKPPPYNPRRVLKPTARSYRTLRASLAEFGLVEPLVWNEWTGHVVGGHARLRILRELGATEVPVSVVRLSEPREKALNIVLNNHEAQGRFDSAALRRILLELQDGPEFELTGFYRLPTVELAPARQDKPRTETERVEVTLVIDPATLEALAPRLDALVREFNVVTHLRRAG
jgi:hypothetical protein